MSFILQQITAVRPSSETTLPRNHHRKKPTTSIAAVEVAGCHDDCSDVRRYRQCLTSSADPRARVAAVALALAKTSMVHELG